MSRRREYHLRLRCPVESCSESTFYVYTTQRDYAEGAKRNKGWKCLRHSDPDRVLRPDNPELTKVLTVSRSPRFPDLESLFWVGEDDTTGNGFAHGFGMRAFADDFPKGARLVVTARIEGIARCEECDDWQHVEDSFPETVGFEEQASDVWVVVFGCGHSSVTPQRRPF